LRPLRRGLKCRFCFGMAIGYLCIIKNWFTTAIIVQRYRYFA